MRELERLADKEAQSAALTDKVETLRVFLEELPATETIERLVREIDQLFSDSNSGQLTLSTIHRAKGLEYSRVFLLNIHFLDDDTRKGKKMQSWEIQQRANLKYVAITRSRKELIYITSEELKTANEHSS